ncbi:30S ribosomal protein S18 [Candidatus Microgenomates bacterium]|nr:30S ribosomal protein S18 [Candidatus Microgenomates bacterium]
MKKQNRRPCHFCQSGMAPTVTDLVALERFLTDRGKIIGRKRTDICAKHQRLLSREIKRARFLALLPFTGAHV